MTGEEYTAALMICAGSARSLSLIDVPDMLRRIENAEAVGPILDPTLYRAQSQKMAEDKELLEAALPLWRMAQKMIAKAEGKSS